MSWEKIYLTRNYGFHKKKVLNYTDLYIKIKYICTTWMEYIYEGETKNQKYLRRKSGSTIPRWGLLGHVQMFEEKDRTDTSLTKIYAKGKGSLTTWNDEGKIDVSSEGPSSALTFYLLTFYC